MKKAAYILIGLNLLFILFNAVANPMPPIGLLVFTILFGPGFFVGALLLSLFAVNEARRGGRSATGSTALVILTSLVCLAYVGLALFAINIRMF